MKPDDADIPDVLDYVAARVVDDAPVDWNRLVESGRLSEREARAARLLEGLRHQHRRDRTGIPIDTGVEKLEEIGSGSFGRVWRAVDRGLNREIALKVLRAGSAVSPAERQRFVTEARALASIDHENVVKIHAIEERDDELRMRLELVRGRTLERVLADEGLLSPDEARHVGVQLCRALAALHQSGVVHRDLKPSNVMREDGGRIVLLDFGLARSGAASDASIAGTPAVMAPEQLTGSATPRSDLFALGALLYWMVSGRPPFVEASPAGATGRPERRRGAPLIDVAPRVPADLASVIERALADDPADRFASAGAMSAALDAARISAPRHRLRTVVASAAAVALLVGLGWAWRDGRPPSAPAPAIDARLVAWRDGRELPLHDGDVVRPGDAIELAIAADHARYVYVFNEDDRGRLFALFPLPGGEQKNPVAGTKRLPGALGGRPQTWVVDSDAASERLLVIASDHPVDAAEALWREAAAAAPEDALAFATASDATRGLWRGMGSLKERPREARAGDERLADLLARLADASREIQLRTFYLPHAPP